MAVIFGLCVVLFVWILLNSITVMRQQSAYADNQGAIDASALTAANWVAEYRVQKIQELGFDRGLAATPNLAAIEDLAMKSFESNIYLDQQYIVKEKPAEFDVKYDNANNRVTVSSCVKVQKLDIGSAFGANSKATVCNSSVAEFTVQAPKTNFEVAISLDASEDTVKSGIIGAYSFGAINKVLDPRKKEFADLDMRMSLVPYVNIANFAPFEEFFASPDGCKMPSGCMAINTCYMDNRGHYFLMPI